MEGILLLVAVAAICIGIGTRIFGPNYIWMALMPWRWSYRLRFVPSLNQWTVDKHRGYETIRIGFYETRWQALAAIEADKAQRERKKKEEVEEWHI